MIVYNDHNATKVIPKVIERIESQSKTFALISDAGTPLVSDPGYKLVNACIENEINFTFIPGPSAVISALVLSGMPSDRFMFAGFADSGNFTELSKIDSTLIFFESPNRVIKTLDQMSKIFKKRKVAVVREITKIFESSVRGSFDFVINHFKNNPPRGEFVILLSPPEFSESDKTAELIPLITALSDRISKKDLSSILAKFSGISKNAIYNFISAHEEKI